MDFGYLLDTVDYTILRYWHDDPRLDKLCPEVKELYLALINPKVEPIKLSLFIEDYMDSDNLYDDFSVDNKELMDFIKQDNHQNIKTRLVIQLAKCYCNKHIETCRLFLCYLELITDPEHRALRDSPKELSDYNILEKLLELKRIDDGFHAPELLVFMLSIANKIVKEYIYELPVCIYPRRRI